MKAELLQEHLENTGNLYKCDKLCDWKFSNFEWKFSNFSTFFCPQKRTLAKDTVRVCRHCYQIFKVPLPQSEGTGSLQGKQVLDMKVGLFATVHKSALHQTKHKP